jgi:hypothetical protein
MRSLPASSQSELPVGFDFVAVAPKQWPFCMRRRSKLQSNGPFACAEGQNEEAGRL